MNTEIIIELERIHSHVLDKLDNIENIQKLEKISERRK